MLKNLKAGSDFYPAIHYNYTFLSSLAGKDGEEIAKQMEKVRGKAGKAVDYPWGNSHDYICDITGTPILTVHVSRDSLHLWAVRGHHSIGEFSIAKMTKKLAEEIMDKVADDKFLCPGCGKWIDVAKKKTYSFAGAVCPKCYNPKKHLPPDTRGD